MAGWMRPRFYKGNGADAFAAGVVEAARVRRHGGICDGSTLGKLEIAGPDAPAFLDRIYLNCATAIEPGRARYAVLLREDGMVLDDGLLLRHAVDRFTATTSSSHTAHVLSHLEFYRDTEWRGQRISISDVTEAWSVIIVAGPQSRAALKTVLGDAWQQTLANLRHMGFAQGTWSAGQDSGARLRVLRASFSGELAFELHCHPAIAGALWQALGAADLAPFGLEALDILRVEKGYLTGSELNGQTTPMDAGLGAMLRAGADGAVRASIGRALLERDGLKGADRPILVGLRAADGKSQFQGGAQITGTASAAKCLGYVTSAVYSPALNQWIGLALVARDHSAAGMELFSRDPLRGADTRVRIVPPTHFDPQGHRIRG